MKRLAKWLFMLLALLAATATIALFGFRRVALERETLQAEAIAPATGRFVPTSQGRFFVQEFGPKTGVPVLIVHGTAAWSGFWREAAVALGAAGHRIVAVDLPPFGLSDPDPAARYSRREQAARLAALIEALGAPRAALIAHSFGSGPVAELVLARPELVSRVIFVAAALGLNEDGSVEQASPVMAAVLHPRLVREMLTAATMTNMFLTQRLLAGMLERREAATPEIAAVLQQPMYRAGSTAAYADWLPELLMPDASALSARADNYRRIAIPVALIWGDADRLTPLAQAHHLQRLMPLASLDVLPGIGHIPHLEAPTATVDLIRIRLENR